MMRLLAILLLAGVASAADYPPLKYDHGTPSPLVQRTMKTLATSTKEKPNTVRILFYGQSITEQKWTDIVLKDLKERFPTANIIAENRALGGFSSQLLVKTAETDLYPFLPDLLIFHVYGAHDKYEEIIRKTRERTSAEILLQTDHVTKPADFSEETDAKKLKPDGKIWDAFMNHKHIPEVAKKYQAAICDQRAMWKHYLKENKLEPKALLKDNVHLNAHGEFLMAECVKASLRYDPECKTIPSEQWRREYGVEYEDVVDFTGVAAELVFRQQGGKGNILIDTKKPSEHSGSWSFSRVEQKPSGKWPIVAGFTPQKLMSEETWTLRVKPDKDNEKLYSFTLKNAHGEEGSGTSDTPFGSKSGLIHLEPANWNVDYALALRGIKPVPDEVLATFKSVLNGSDIIDLDFTSDNTERRILIVNGLPNKKHTFQVKGRLAKNVTLLIHSPPFPAK